MPACRSFVAKTESTALKRRYYEDMPVDVVLRDFDGSRTIYPTELPLRELINTAETEDLGTVVGKIYAKTDETDDHGRVIYAEQR